MEIVNNWTLALRGRTVQYPVCFSPRSVTAVVPGSSDRPSGVREREDDLCGMLPRVVTAEILVRSLSGLNLLLCPRSF
ncbi:hypothetical protein RRG08_016064 [Elysia crispata]|uniref:Uncharacterized protein n=1 Tax=Elysia crispata TaxID=231223 RepID=A0AAE1DJ84_9GAST|nr:hypothetical protein RRG08_016064 [Elysia crispata]